jgi:hypothetical protein
MERINHTNIYLFYIVCPDVEGLQSFGDLVFFAKVVFSVCIRTPIAALSSQARFSSGTVNKLSVSFWHFLGIGD